MARAIYPGFIQEVKFAASGAQILSKTLESRMKRPVSGSHLNNPVTTAASRVPVMNCVYNQH
jgi:hypothetical protein